MLLQTAPRAIGAVLEDGICLYRQSLLSVWPLALGTTLLDALSGFLVDAMLQQVSVARPEAAFAAVMQSAYWFNVFFSGIIYIAAFTILIVHIDTIARGAAWSPRDALVFGSQRIWPMVVLTFLFLKRIVFGFVALIRPKKKYWSGKFHLAAVPLVLNKANLSESFMISRRLVNGQWWRASAIVAVGFVVPIVVGLSAKLIGGELAEIMRADQTTSLIIKQVASGVTNVFLLSLPPSVMLTLYYDLKLAKDEGPVMAPGAGLHAQS